MRVPVVVLRRESHQREQVLDGALGAVRRLDPLDLERRADDRTDRLPRVERGLRVLEHHLDVTAQGTQLTRSHVRDVTALEHDPAVGGLCQTRQQPARGRLATAGLADQSQRLPGPHRQVDAVHRLDRTHRPAQQTPLDGEMLLQRGDGQQHVRR